MIVKTLAENTAISDQFGSEHGLSLYIETAKHKLLFDTGKSKLFFTNAEKMGIDLTEVDTVIISHGHYDHGGGLNWFLQINSQAKIYIHQKAFADYYSKRESGAEYIGLDKNLQTNNRIIFTENSFPIDDELELFSGIKGKELPSLANKTLMVKQGNAFTEDTFEHEQNLIITENGKTLLLAGCAHNGIVNITERVYQLKRKYADVVIGGFHLFNPSTQKTEKPQLIQAIGERLKTTDSQYYTCHCTGYNAFNQLKLVMEEQIEYLATGSILEI